MYNGSFLLKSSGSFYQILIHQCQSLFVFLDFSLILGLPFIHIRGGDGFSVLFLLILLQGICLLTVLVQIVPLFLSDLQDGFLEMWIGNQGGKRTYYLIRQIIASIEIIFPALFLSVLLCPPLSGVGYGVFLGLNAFLCLLTALWGGNMALLLANRYETGYFLAGIGLTLVFLIPLMLISGTILEEVGGDRFSLSHLFLYGGVSLLGIAINLGVSPFIIHLSVDC